MPRHSSPAQDEDEPWRQGAWLSDDYFIIGEEESVRGERRRLSVLVVDDEPAHAEAIVRAFTESDPEVAVQVAVSLAGYRRLTTVVAGDRPDLAIIDLNLPDGRAVEVLTYPPEEGPFPVLVMTSYGNEETAVEAMKAGAIDYVIKSPEAFAVMPRKVTRALREWDLLQERRQARAMIEGLAQGWQQTFDAIPYPVFLRNTQGRITQCNRATEEFSGTGKGEIVGRYCWEVIHQAGGPIMGCPLPAMTSSRQRETMSLMVRDRVYQVSVDPVINRSGELIGAVHSMEDITERRRTEETLREQENELAAIYDNAPMIMMLVDSERVVRKVNRQALTLVGGSPANMVGLRGGEALGCIHAFEHPDGCGFAPQCPECVVRRTVMDTLETGVSHYQVEVRLVLSVNGEEKSRPFLLSTTRILLRGEAMALLSFMDISQLKEVEESLRSQTEQYRVLSQEFHALLEAIPDVITLHSPNLEVVWANRRAVVGMGKEMSEVIGRPCYALWHNRTTPCDPCPVLRTFHNGEPSMETITTSDGRVWDVRAVAVKEEERVVNVLEVSRDITDSRRMEEQIRHSQKMDTIGTLAGGIAHDFNNILTAILGYANLSLDDLQPGSQTAKDILQVIYAGERARELVKQILTFSRQRAEETQPVQASPLVKEALKLLRASIPSTIEIRDRILAQGVTIMIDPTKLHQVVMNLCTNAYQAMKAAGGTMVVTLEPVLFPEEGGWFGQQRVSGEYLRLTVQDTGVGMDKATLERIFEPYFTTKGKEDGTGLGLSVVHGIVKSCKGYIDVQSTLGQGSLFQVLWPVFQGPPQDREVEVVSLPGGHERVLLVDDEQAIANLYERTLRGLGYQVTCRTSSLEALELFRHSAQLFDLVITDYSMPKLDGIAFAERLLSLDPLVKIILMTGFSETHSEESLARVGIGKLLLKPVVRQELALAIRDLLDA